MRGSEERSDFMFAEVVKLCILPQKSKSCLGSDRVALVLARAWPACLAMSLDLGLTII